MLQLMLVVTRQTTLADHEFNMIRTRTQDKVFVWMC
jgi:hypothetical protein